MSLRISLLRTLLNESTETISDPPLISPKNMTDPLKKDFSIGAQKN